MSINPSSARQIADTVIHSAEHLDSNFDIAQTALDDLFTRTYDAVRAGRKEAQQQAPAKSPMAPMIDTPPPAAPGAPQTALV
jgi:hypothetical protein